MKSASILILGIAILMSAAANAMPIPQFDQMAGADRANYVTTLVDGTSSGLKAHGQTAQALKLETFFATAGDKGGVQQLLDNLKIARTLNKQNESDPKFTPYQVENAFALTLKHDGITVPLSFLLSINKDFVPSHPPAKP